MNIPPVMTTIVEELTGASSFTPALQFIRGLRDGFAEQVRATGELKARIEAANAGALLWLNGTTNAESNRRVADSYANRLTRLRTQTAHSHPFFRSPYAPGRKCLEEVQHTTHFEGLHHFTDSLKRYLGRVPDDPRFQGYPSQLESQTGWLNGNVRRLETVLEELSQARRVRIHHGLMIWGIAAGLAVFVGVAYVAAKD